MHRPTAQLASATLSPEVLRGPGVRAAGEPASAQQLARSAARPTVDAVRLQVEGRTVTTLWEHLDRSEPVRPGTSSISA